MTQETEAQPTNVTPTAAGSSLRWPLAIAFLAIAAQLAMRWETVLSIVSIWNRSETYTHGWIIGPIAGYLIWTKRQELQTVVITPSLLGAGVLVGLNFMWLLGHLAGAQVVSQYALVGMIPAIVWAVLGTRFVWRIAFPMLFLFLAVPSGEVLVPRMVDFTADFTVRMLQFTGVPVYREGTYFSVPSGEWSVVEACSGIRYLIASFTGGCLFAYLYYRSIWRRITIILASIVIPIIANGFRAYMIVMIGHLSDMRLAVGVDHFIYGWVFFGLVMFLLFWVASMWRESDPAQDAAAAGREGSAATVSIRPLLAMTVGILAIAVGWTVFSHHLDTNLRRSGEVVFTPPAAVVPWSVITAPLTPWRPRYMGFDLESNQVFASPSGNVALHIAYYKFPGEGKELISATNILVGGANPRWRTLNETTRRELDDSLPIREAQLHIDDGHLLVWQWSVVSDRHFTNPFLGKWLLSIDRLLGRSGEGAAVFIAAPFDGINPESARSVLRGFAREMMPSIDDSLRKARLQ